jgi:hypothetical protein
LRTPCAEPITPAAQQAAAKSDLKRSGGEVECLLSDR